MAYILNKLVKDDSMNHQIGENARELALKRHDRDKIIECVCSTYNDVINGN